MNRFVRTTFDLPDIELDGLIEFIQRDKLIVYFTTDATEPVFAGNGKNKPVALL